MGEIGLGKLLKTPIPFTTKTRKSGSIQMNMISSPHYDVIPYQSKTKHKKISIFERNIGAPVDQLKPLRGLFAVCKAKDRTKWARGKSQGQAYPSFVARALLLEAPTKMA